MKIFLGIIILIVAVLIAFVAYLYLYKEKCESFECFQKNMARCTGAVYVNSEPEADWRYEVDGISTEGCKVNVKLLQAKKGDLGVDKLQGFEMSCYYPIGVSSYPEKDLSACHGRLKEELQGIIIEKLHTHILENLGKIDEGLKKAV